MEYNIDAENEVEIAKYRNLDLPQIKNDKQRIQLKLCALENKLKNHKKYLPDIIELEKQEIIMVYQEYLKEVTLNKEQVGKVLNHYNLFDKILFPPTFADIYSNIDKNF